MNTRNNNLSEAQEQLFSGCRYDIFSKVVDAINLGADVNALDDFALTLAVSRSSPEIIQYLLDHRANPQARDDFIFLEAIKSKKIDNLKLIMTHCPLTELSQAVFCAISFERLNIVHYFVQEYNYDIDDIIKTSKMLDKEDILSWANSHLEKKLLNEKLNFDLIQPQTNYKRKKI